MQKWVNIYFWGYDSVGSDNTVVRIKITSRLLIPGCSIIHAIWIILFVSIKGVPD